MKKKLYMCLLAFISILICFECGTQLVEKKADAAGETVGVLKAGQLHEFTKKDGSQLKGWEKYLNQGNYMYWVKTQEGDDIFCIQPKKDYPFNETLNLEDTYYNDKVFNYLVSNYNGEKEFIKGLDEKQQYIVTQLAIFARVYQLQGKSDENNQDYQAAPILIEKLLAAGENSKTPQETVDQLSISISPQNQPFQLEGDYYTAEYDVDFGMDQASLTEQKVTATTGIAALDPFVKTSWDNGRLKVSIPKEEANKYTPQDFDVNIRVCGKITVNMNIIVACKSKHGNQTMIIIRKYQIKASNEMCASVKGNIKWPVITTKATNYETGEKSIEAGNPVKIRDTIRYVKAFANQEYTLVGKLMDQATGKPIMNDGKAVTASKTFTTTEKKGDQEVVFDFDASELAGRKVVVFEELWLDGSKVAVHEDLNDENQTVEVKKKPAIKTKATNYETGGKSVKPDNPIKIKDTVSYQDLIPNQEYELIGYLKDQATGEPIMNGSEAVTAKKTFTPAQKDGTQEIVFEFDASELGGRKVVVFEELWQAGVKVAVHEDLKDEDQTIEVEKKPEIKTKATNYETGGKTVEAVNPIKIKDTVTYQNLVPNKKYELVGRLMDQVSGQPVMNGTAAVTAKTTFTPTQKDGTAEVDFELDASKLGGRKVVVFEELQLDGKNVATHEDLSDEDQTIDVGETPEIKTKATNYETGGKSIGVGNPVKIKDTVTYKNLSPNKNYELIGYLKDQATGDPIMDGLEKVTAKAYFTPTDKDGEAEVIFTFDASKLGGRKVVVFEELWANGKKIAVHEDINDENQTIEVEKKPVIKTKATNYKTGEKTIEAGNPVKIKDTVTYQNLTPNQEYELIGYLKDQATSRPIMNGSKEVTAKKTFTPTKKDGTAEVVFELDASELAGRKVVVFEELLLDGKKVASHEDLTDKDQTIDVENKGGITLRKIDGTNNGSLSGADFKIALDSKGATFFSEDVLPVGDGETPGKGTYRAEEQADGSWKFIADSSVTPKGHLVIEGMPSGEYYFVEIKAPSGYQLSSKELQFNIALGKSSDQKIVDFENHPKSILPKTGGSGILLWLGAGGIAVLSFISYVLMGQRRKAGGSR